MALAEMSKARIAVHRSVADELIGKLQAIGCCEFTKESSGPIDSAAMFQLRARQRHIDELLSDVRFTVRLLEPLEVNKGSSIARMLGDVPTIGISELTAKADEDRFRTFVTDLREKERKATETRAEISRLKGLLTQLIILSSIKYPLEFFTSGTEMIGGAVYTIPRESSEEFVSRLESELGGFVEYQKLLQNEKDTTIIFAVLFKKSDLEKIQTVACEFSAGRLDVPKDLELTAEEERKKLTAEIEKAEKEEALLSAEIASMAEEGLEMARYYGDYWSILRDRMDSMISGVPTDDVFIWLFWMPKQYQNIVEKTISPYESLSEFSYIEPDEGELPPTLLKNPGWSSSMEPLTLMYGTPTYGGIDPTSLMAPFFFLFLGMCFGDAGYGLVMSGIFGYFIIRHQLPPTMRKFFVMLTIGMIFSVIVGALTGSWFGDSITAFPFLSSLIPLKESIQMLDPMNDPMTLLTISLGLGFTQVIFGLLIAFKNSWSNRDYVEALADNGGWIIFLFGLLLTGFASYGMIKGPAAGFMKYIAIAGAVILIATQGRTSTSIGGKFFSGLLSLYNVTGYLGDVLSYSRLLALGLGSAAVGMVINLLAKLVVGTPYVGIPLAILIFVVGHIFSIAVNLLGAFIHSLRLQYVEFFGKFYDANGKDFKPLCNVTTFARLSEEKQ
ncbi:MAG: V-type ATP synthase subunit I [Synergistaceae bacterium]|nr:V-type ATP synthase subunit I [Synergistaceae bacterium]